MTLRDRIVGFERVPREKLRRNPKNWRTHNNAQRNALNGVLEEVGIVDAVIARHLSDGTYELIDGHLRSETIEQDIPTLIVDLDDREAAEVLATLDPLAAMAGANADALDSLLKQFTSSSAAVQAMVAELAEKAGILSEIGDGAPIEGKEYDEDIESEVEFLECPACSHRWPK